MLLLPNRFYDIKHICYKSSNSIVLRNFSPVDRQTQVSVNISKNKYKIELDVNEIILFFELNVFNVYIRNHDYFRKLLVFLYFTS